MARILLLEGDIADQGVDAIVNAANTALVLGAGVAGAIRNKGGNSIQEECNEIGPVALGEVALTKAGSLPASYVIHAAGIHPGGEADESSIRACVRASLELARDRGFRTIALPAIGTGIAGFGLQRCAEVSLEEARRHCEAQTSLEEIRFVLWGEPAFRVFEMVNDSAKVAAQMERIAASRKGRSKR